MNHATSPIASNEISTGDSSASGRVTTENGRKRYKRIFEAGFSALISKGAVLLVNLVSIPIAVRYLGSVQFGIWATITTSLSVLLVLDLGIANTLTNLISEAYAKEDQDLAGRYATTAFWMMVLVASTLGALGYAAWPFIGWDRIFHVDESFRGTVSSAVAVAYGVFLCGMPAGLAAKMLGGYQELRTANLFAAVGSVGSLVGIILVVRLHGGLPLLIGVSSGATVLASGLCLFWIWLYHKPWLTPWPRNMSRFLSRRLMQSGSAFFLLQVSGLVVFNSDNLVIAHFIGPAEVTPYNVTWRIVGYAAVLQSLMVPALWPAYSEAYVRGDMAWIRKTYWRVMKLTTSAGAICCIAFVFFGRTIIRYWAGEIAVPTQSLVIAMCAWVMISIVMSNEACLLAAANEIRLQMWLGLMSAAVNLISTILLVKRIGILGVILGTIFSYIFVVVGPQSWKVMQVMRGYGTEKLARAK